MLRTGLSLRSGGEGSPRVHRAPGRRPGPSQRSRQGSGHDQGVLQLLRRVQRRH